MELQVSEILKQEILCYKRGFTFPHKRDKPCPAKNAICSKCKKPGHFAKLCRTRKQTGDLKPTQGRNQNNRRPKRHTARAILENTEQESDMSSSKEECLFCRKIRSN